jgi:hypothetical protein
VFVVVLARRQKALDLQSTIVLLFLATTVQKSGDLWAEFMQGCQCLKNGLDWREWMNLNQMPCRDHNPVAFSLGLYGMMLLTNSASTHVGTYWTGVGKSESWGRATIICLALISCLPY